jgi:hypothetical protein
MRRCARFARICWRTICSRTLPALRDESGTARAKAGKAGQLSTEDGPCQLQCTAGRVTLPPTRRRVDANRGICAAGSPETNSTHNICPTWTALLVALRVIWLHRPDTMSPAGPHRILLRRRPRRRRASERRAYSSRIERLQKSAVMNSRKCSMGLGPRRRFGNTLAPRTLAGSSSDASALTPHRHGAAWESTTHSYGTRRRRGCFVDPGLGTAAGEMGGTTRYTFGGDLTVGMVSKAARVSVARQADCTSNGRRAVLPRPPASAPDSRDPR